MADAEFQIRKVTNKIANKQEYQNCEITLKPVSTGGANYTSQLFIITLSAPGKNGLSLFAKLAILSQKVRSQPILEIYDKEILFYTKILPKYKELEEAYRFSKEERLTIPKYYGGSLEYMKEVIVLEELSAKGYQPFDRFKCFDWEYAAQCVSVLARFHALSFSSEKINPEGYLGMVDKLKYWAPPERLNHLLNKTIVKAVKVTDEIYRARVQLFLENCMKKNTFTTFFYPERRLVLNHGDFRPSNILHKMDEDGQLKVVLLDYQMIYRGNPVCDLLNFLIGGSDEEFRAKHLHEFFNHYYKTLCKALRRLEVDPDAVYPEKDYRNDLKEMLPFGLTLGTFILLFVTVEESDAPKPEDGFDVFNFDFATTDLFRTRFNALVRDYVKLGIL